MKRTGPPKFAERILGILSASRKTGVLGDTEEEYRMILSKKGRFRADMWYALQILKPLPYFIRSTLYWRFIMFKNYFKTALRHINRHKWYSFINIAGLTIGMTCCILILLYILHLGFIQDMLSGCLTAKDISLQKPHLTYLPPPGQ